MVKEKNRAIEEFSRACDLAYNDLFITLEEMQTAIKKYKCELKNARTK